MRIALFSGNYNYVRDGANQALNKLASYLEGQGHEIRAYSPVTDTPAFEPAGTLVPVPSVALPVRGEFRLALGLPRSIRRDLDQYQPDIVHVSTPDILGTRAQTYAIARGIPVVASMHTRFETYLDYYGLGWLQPILQAHLDRFYRRSTHVLAPTPGIVDELKAVRRDEGVSLWSRGVNRELFSPELRDMDWRRAQGFHDEDVVVLFFGRLVLEKGVEIFAEVVRALQSKARVRALVVGAGPAEEAFLSLPGTVLTGHLEGPALGRAVASADLMLSPSTTEAFGNVVLEAMASGLPVVSADASNARMLLVEGQTGALCRPRDVADYVDKLLPLVTSDEMRRSFGDAARQASQSYSWDAASQSVEQVYRSLLPA